MIITATILVFEQIGQKEYKTIPYTKHFTPKDNFADVLHWIKSVDKSKSIKDVYFNDNN